MFCWEGSYFITFVSIVDEDMLVAWKFQKLSKIVGSQVCFDKGLSASAIYASESTPQVRINLAPTAMQTWSCVCLLDFDAICEYVVLSLSHVSRQVRKVDVEQFLDVI